MEGLLVRVIFKCFWWCVQKLPFRFPGLFIIGIKRTGALGDVLLTTPIIRELKKNHPKAFFWVQTDFKEVFVHHPDVDWILSHGIEKGVSILIDLDLAYEKKPNIHIVDAYSYAAIDRPLDNKRLFLFSSKRDLRKVSKVLKGKLNIYKDAYIVMHQAVSWDNRTWSKGYWEELTQAFISKGYKIAIVGRKKDFSQKEQGGVVNLHSKLTLSQIKELIHRSCLFVGTDSALFHVAMATESPVVGLFTVANPELRVTRKENTISLIPKSSCRFCLHQQKAPVTRVDCVYGTDHCVKEITPQEVLAASQKLLSKKGANDFDFLQSPD